MNTNTNYSPHNLLPAPEPRLADYPEDYFYENVSKHLIKDIVRIMSNGIPIDMIKVQELENTLDELLETTHKSIQEHPIIQQFKQEMHKELKENYIKLLQTKLKLADNFIKPFDIKNVTHRSYLMHVLNIVHPNEEAEKVHLGIVKWTLLEVKKYASNNPTIKLLLLGKLTDTNKFVKEAINLLAKHKAEIYNKKYYNNIDNSNTLELPVFNRGSSTQKQQLFNYLNIESESTSKVTGAPKWDRPEIERISNETDNPEVKSLMRLFIDYSYGAIVRNNFIEAFNEYTIDNRLYGTLKLFGAKSFRLTSQNPNLLNAPSTKSIYSKPVKSCFVAPPGFVILAVDYNALEDRVMASLTKDVNKCLIFAQDLDGHSFNTLGYDFPELPEQSKLFRDIHNLSKGKYFREILPDGTIKYFREFD